jgi:hypothetical protein
MDLRADQALDGREATAGCLMTEVSSRPARPTSSDAERNLSPWSGGNLYEKIVRHKRRE